MEQKKYEATTLSRRDKRGINEVKKSQKISTWKRIRIESRCEWYDGLEICEKSKKI